MSQLFEVLDFADFANEYIKNMGCDIHLWVEVKTAEGWHPVHAPESLKTPLDIKHGLSKCYWCHRGPVEYGGKYSCPCCLGTEVRLSNWYNDRSYVIFSALAGVRNFGTYSLEPMVYKRGLPEDLSPELARVLEDTDHNQNWATLAEIVAYDWNQEFIIDWNGKTTIRKLSEWSENWLVIVDEMLKLGDPENVRIVFYFDS